MEFLLAGGAYEREEIAAVTKLLRDGDVVLELGGGLGYVSAYLRSMTKVGRIITYEANADLIPYIRDVHRINQVKEIEVRHGVVLSKPLSASLPFYVRADFWESSLYESDGAIARIAEVPAVSWRAVLDELKPSAAIIDIEGGELDLLEADTFGPIRRLIVEAHPALYGTSGMKRLFDGLVQHGFRYVAKATKGNVLALERRVSGPVRGHRLKPSRG
jgi:FkbM family methyltransferase